MGKSLVGRVILGVLVFVAFVYGAVLISGKAKIPVPVSAEFKGEGDRRLHIQLLSSSEFAFNYLPVSEDVPSLLTVNAKGVAGAKQTADAVETEDLMITVNKENLCMDVYDKHFGVSMVELCPQPETFGFSLRAPLMTHAYGLGEQLSPVPGLSWVGKKRTPGNEMGNKMVNYDGGAVSNAQFPVLYALGNGKQNFALVYDNTFAQTWDFENQPWVASATGGPLRGVFIGGRDLVDLRHKFMELAGKPPVPPRKAFGLWVSEYGYENWAELDSKRESLFQNGFPVDGFVLDLQWFGGLKKGSEVSPMGGLQWDLKNFPDPKKKIAELKEQGLGIVVIEEPFISRKTVDRESGKVIHEELAQKGFLAMEGKGPDAKPVRLDPTLWWGNGGMMDFVSREANDFWHDWKRQPLIDIGVMGHWTDLGEPEEFSAKAYYDKGMFRHAQVHNIYNLRWSEGVFRGYERNKVEQRPWILSRSGTIGSQRYGVALWSGDIGANLESLEATTRAQGNVSLSGIDYFGSDIGGFWRKALRGKLSEMYTQWLVDSSLFDVPVRVHAYNLENKFETAPDRVGHVVSNLEAVRLRHRLIPYYYSLAHEAQRGGAALISPLVYLYQSDPNVRDLSDHKMIGPFLLGVAIAAENIQERGVYLPEGMWFDFYNDAAVVSQGEWLGGRIVRWEGVIRAPLYAREGALIPMQDDKGVLTLKVYPSKTESKFTLWEDDGATQAYLKGARRSTALWQRHSANGVRIRISGAQGTFTGAPETRSMGVEVVSEVAPKSVTLNGQELPTVPTKENNFWVFQNGLVKIWLAEKPVAQAQELLISPAGFSK